MKRKLAAVTATVLVFASSGAWAAEPLRPASSSLTAPIAVGATTIKAGSRVGAPVRAVNRATAGDHTLGYGMLGVVLAGGIIMAIKWDDESSVSP